jgi:hypothetical protein
MVVGSEFPGDNNFVSWSCSTRSMARVKPTNGRRLVEAWREFFQSEVGRFTTDDEFVRAICTAGAFVELGSRFSGIGTASASSFLAPRLQLPPRSDLVEKVRVRGSSCRDNVTVAPGPERSAR